MNTVFFLFGVSGSGKSTRSWALISFLESIGCKPKYIDYKGTTLAREYLDSFIIVGKEVTRNGFTNWQGADVFIRTLTEEKGLGNMYDWIWKTAEKQNLVLDSASMLRTFRSRPFEVEKQPYPLKSYNRAYWYEEFEAYKRRILGRSPKAVVTEDSSMWFSNKQLKNSLRLVEEEIQKAKYPERHESFRGDPDEPVWTVGVDILSRTGNESLVEKFKEYCTTFELPVPKLIKEESLF